MVVGGQRQSPDALPSETGQGNNFIGGWVVSGGRSEGVGKSRSHRDSIPGP